MSQSHFSDRKTETMREFCDFIEAESIDPSSIIDDRIESGVKKELEPSIAWLYAKFVTIESGAGIATLFICPQFGFQLNGHSEFFHTLHEQAGFFSFYLICGLLFVILGAAMSALLLSFNELKSIGLSKYFYYLAFGVLAFLSFFLAGGDVLLMSVVPWILGAYLGNLVGFQVIARVRLNKYISPV
jgi:hypothetical protein